MRHIINIFISFIFFSILWICIVYFQIGNPTQTSKWVYEAYELKEQYGKSIKNQKIVVVSGSNTLFGIDSKRLEEEWGIPVVNDAVHAGLGMPYILYKSQKILKEGDIVILPLEYSFYTMIDTPSEVYSDYILSRDSKYFYSLSVLEKLKIISSVGLKRVLKGFESYVRPLKRTEGVYGIQNINSNGDQINIDYDSMSEQDFKTIDNLKADKIKTTLLSSVFVKNLDSYISWAKKKKITLIFMPPNHMYFEDYDSDEYQIFLNNIKNYYDDRNVSYIGSPKKYMYEKKYYFNTSYHLNNIGVEQRTRQLINDVSLSIFDNINIDFINDDLQVSK